MLNTSPGQRRSRSIRLPAWMQDAQLARHADELVGELVRHLERLVLDQLLGALVHRRAPRELGEDDQADPVERPVSDDGLRRHLDHVVDVLRDRGAITRGRTVPLARRGIRPVARWHGNGV